MEVSGRWWKQYAKKSRVVQVLFMISSIVTTLHTVRDKDKSNTGKGLEGLRVLKIIASGSNLSLFFNKPVSANEVLEYLNKWFEQDKWLLNEVIECLQLYCKLGGSVRYFNNGNDSYYFLNNFDTEKKYTMADGFSFFYGKTKEAAKTFEQMQRLFVGL